MRIFFPLPTSLAITTAICSCSPLASITESDNSDESVTTIDVAPTSTGQTTAESESVTTGCSDSNVDPGEQCDDGDTTLNEYCQPDCRLTPKCGNGVHEAGEDCDDGNAISTDACLNDCRLASCGDGFLHDGEECDDGNSLENDDCTNNCISTVCGDGSVSGWEKCDDGNQVNEDACLTTCVPASCGDGHVQTDSEACDDGNQVLTDACGMCMSATCGDGVTWVGVEQCDDGNSDNTDQCSSECLVTRIAFVTSSSFNGNLGGLAGADLKCKTAAKSLAFRPPDTKWRAWLSDGSNSPAQRLDVDFMGEYRRPDGKLIAQGWAGLTTGFISSPMLITEEVGSLDPLAKAWTNTLLNGEQNSSNHCKKWTYSAGDELGNNGRTNSQTATWTNFISSFCFEELHIYCFED